MSLPNGWMKIEARGIPITTSKIHLTRCPLLKQAYNPKTNTVYLDYHPMCVHLLLDKLNGIPQDPGEILMKMMTSTGLDNPLDKLHYLQTNYPQEREEVLTRLMVEAMEPVEIVETKEGNGGNGSSSNDGGSSKEETVKHLLEEILGSSEKSDETKESKEDAETEESKESKKTDQIKNIEKGISRHHYIHPDWYQEDGSDHVVFLFPTRLKKKLIGKTCNFSLEEVRTIYRETGLPQLKYGLGLLGWSPDHLLMVGFLEESFW